MKANIFKRALSAVLAGTLACGMLVSTAVAYPNSGKLVTIEGKTEKEELGEIYDYDVDIKKNKTIRVHYKVYLDSSYSGLETLYVNLENVTGIEVDDTTNPPTTTEVNVLEFTGDIECTQVPDAYITTVALDKTQKYDYIDLFYEGGCYPRGGEGHYIDFWADYLIKEPDILKDMLDEGNVTFPMSFPENDGFESQAYDTDGNPDPITPNYFEKVEATLKASKTYTVNYVLGEDVPSTIEVPEEKRYGKDDEVPVAKIDGLEYDKDGHHYVFKQWNAVDDNDVAIDSINPVARDAESFVMPEKNVTLKAVYAESDDGDDIPDDEQVTITYKVRERDKVGVKGIDFGANATDVVANESAKVSVLKDKEIETLPTVQTDEENKWYFNDPAKEEAGFYVGTDKIDTTFAPAADTEIEIRLVKDENGDNIDDETAVVAKVTYEGVEKTTEPNKVPQNAKYTVVVGNTEIASGNADAGVIALTEAKVPYKNADHYPVVDWTVEAVDTTEPADGVYDEVKITVIYGNELDTTDVTPGKPIIDGTDGDEEKEPSTDPVKLEKRTNVVFIDGDDKDTANVLEIVEIGDEDPASIPEEKFPASYVAGETENTGGNKFVAWVLKGNVDPKRAYDAEPTHEKEAYHKNYYLMVPKFEKSATVKIEKAGKDGEPNTTIAENLDIAIGKKIKVVNENNEPIDFQLKDDKGNDIIENKVTGSGTVVVPNAIDENIPVKKGDDYFKGNWEATKDANGDVILSPKFEPLTSDDIVIVPVEIDPDDDFAPDGYFGDVGYSILKGEYANNNVGRIYFYMSIAGRPGTKANEGQLSAVASGSYDYKNKGVSFGAFENNGKFIFDEERSTEKYGAYYVEYKMTKTGVVTVTTEFKEKVTDLESMKTVKYDLIMVGDSYLDIKLTSMDITVLGRIIAKKIDEPAKVQDGGNYRFEIMDVNKDGKITSQDITILGRAIADKIVIVPKK